GGSVVHIRNTGSHALTAFLVELVDYPGSHFTEYMDEVAGSPIVPGENRSYAVKNMTIGAAPEYVKVTAAIYGDGSSAGEPERVQRLLGRRRETLRTTNELIKRLEAAESAGASREVVSDSLKQWIDSLPPPAKSKSVNKENASAGAALLVISETRAELASHSVAETLDRLRRARQALAASKPAL
ncbi:MAG: hypothetical protein JO022_12865, partial [Acidobacteriaceae bacterium]|nr:hypothetical protein [Acidobacteriaceae bacterium]